MILTCRKRSRTEGTVVLRPTGKARHGTVCFDASATAEVPHSKNGGYLYFKYTSTVPCALHLVHSSGRRTYKLTDFWRVVLLLTEAGSASPVSRYGLQCIHTGMIACDFRLLRVRSFLCWRLLT